jgi:hypothetical protein
MPKPSMSGGQRDIANLEAPLTAMIDPEICLDAKTKVPSHLLQTPPQLCIGNAAVGQEYHSARNGSKVAARSTRAL